MNDARISTTLPEHPKTKKLAKRVGAVSCWHLVCLFLWAAANRSSGSLAGMTDEDIELAVNWTGADGEFVAALKAVGFLDGVECAYEIHDWAEHNPWVAGAEARSEKSRWAALCKQHGRHEAARMMPDYAARLVFSGQSDETGKLTALLASASGMPVAALGTTPSPSPSPSPFPNPNPNPNPNSIAADAVVNDGGIHVELQKSSAIAKIRASGTRIPYDWKPSVADREFATTKGVDADHEAEKFRDHWLGKPGAAALKADWSATWRTWIRNSLLFNRERSAQRPHQAKLSAHTNFDAIDYQKDANEWNSN